MPKMLSFYRDILGLRVGFSNAGFAELSGAGGAGVALHSGADTASHPDADVMIEFLVDDIEAAVQELAARGVSVSPIRDEPFGRIAGFQDPEGHRIGLEQPPRRHR